MIYHVGDKLIINGVEAEVALVTVYNQAYVSPLHDGDTYNSEKVLKGVVFAVLDHHGKDKYGNKALPMYNTECMAV